MSKLGEWTQAGVVGGGVMLFVWPFVAFFRFLFKNPILGSLVLLAMYLFIQAFQFTDEVFGINSEDFSASLNLTERELSELNGAPYHCDHSGGMVASCNYQNNSAKVLFDGDGRSYQVYYDFPNLVINRDFRNNDEFYRYALDRTGFDYSAPTFANIDMIEWKGIYSKDGSGPYDVMVTSNARLGVEGVTVSRHFP